MDDAKNIHRELINRCKKGDVAAQYSIYKCYARAMYNVSIRLMGNQMDAEDMLQESFIQAFDKVESYRGESDFGAWLKRIVINRCISQLRKRKLQFTELDERSLHVADETGIDEGIQPEMIHRAIKELPEGVRVILNLYAFEGYKHKEIAEMLKISESTSKTQYMRAKQLLADKIKLMRDEDQYG